MEFQLLGSVSVTGGGGPVQIGPSKRRSLLAMLLLRTPAAVSIDALTEALWDDEPPLHARTVIQGHVSRLRALISETGLDAYDVELTTQGRAYALLLPETLLDARRFEDLVKLARRQRDPSDAALMLREALALWRGPALNGTVSTPPLLAAAAALEESRLATVEQLAVTYAELGSYGQAVELLSAETVAHPLRETLIAELMRALYRAGRQSDALEQYHRTRRELVDEMGVDPGPVLQAAYKELLDGAAPTPLPGPAGATDGAAQQQEPAEDTATPTPAEETRPPDLLPRPPRGFHGRAPELALLTRATTGEAPLALVTGPAGVGKTALVVHWAHAHAADHPDGLLFADLRGHSGDAPAEPADVLREFLLALGVRAAAVPDSTEAAAALYRSLVKGRRLLVVLDNAEDSAQVRPLLPGGAACTTVVTSRSRLDALMASDCATPVPVEVLDEDAAALLLTGALGADAEPDAVRAVARLCDGLPLALRIAAARLKGRRHWTVADLAAELAGEQGRLALLSAEDTGIVAALRASVARLTDTDAALLGALGHSFVRESDPYAAAAAAGLPLAEARGGLDRLAASHLVQEAGPSRYALHDLVRLYARDLPRSEPHTEVTRRLVDHWLRAQHAAVTAIDATGYRTTGLPAGLEPGLPVPEFGAPDATLAWCAAEQDSLVAALDAAARLGDDERTWRIGALLWPLVQRHPHPDRQAPLRTALAAAERTGDPEGIGRLRATTGVLFVELGQYAQAEALLADALEPLGTFAPELVAQALVLIGVARREQGAPEGALAALADAAHTARRADHPTAALLEHHHACQLAVSQGDFTAAAALVERSLAAVPANETVGWRPLIRESYGIALHRSGRHQEAREALLAALAAAEEDGLPARGARTLTHLAEVAGALEDPAGKAAYEAEAERLRKSLAAS